MVVVRERWFSPRAVSLHVAVLLVVPGCAIAAWWQINRAQDGNQLSYLYSVMWPVFALLALCFWWMLVHTDYESVGLKGMRRAQAHGPERAAAQISGGDSGGSPHPTTGRPVVSAARWRVEDLEDPELAAYNARLAELAANGPKTWRSRETVVVRRPQ
jgi:hypothetical protein